MVCRAQLFEAEYFDFAKDIPFWLESCHGHNPILELGIGCGRVALSLARKGHFVYGVDNDQNNLNLAQRRILENELSDKVFLINQDYRKLNLGLKFPRIICPFNTVSYVRDSYDLYSLFKGAEGALSKKGEFIFDVQLPLHECFSNSNQSTRYFKFRNKKIKCVEEVYTNFIHNKCQIKLSYYDGGRCIKKIVENLKLLTISEIELASKFSGLKLEKIYGGFDKKPLDRTKGWIICKLRKK